MVRRIPVDLMGVDTSARPRRHLVGVQGATVLHIQDITGTRVKVRGQEAEGFLEFVVSGRDAVSTDNVIEICEDLIKHVFEDLRTG